MQEKNNEIILFENQGVKLEVNLKEETVWLTQAQMEELFAVKHATISEHINNIFKEDELEEKTSVGISDKSTGNKNIKGLYVRRLRSKPTKIRIPRKNNKIN